LKLWYVWFNLQKIQIWLKSTKGEIEVYLCPEQKGETAEAPQQPDPTCMQPPEDVKPPLLLDEPNSIDSFQSTYQTQLISILLLWWWPAVAVLFFMWLGPVSSECVYSIIQNFLFIESGVWPHDTNMIDHICIVCCCVFGGARVI